MDTDRELRDLIAERAIRRVLVAYTFATDAKDVSGVRACFWADATLDWQYLGVGAAADVLPVVAAANDQFVHHQHFLVQGLITVDPDGTTAASHSYALAYLRSAQPGSDAFDLVVGVHYHDRHERREGEWRIAHRRVLTPWMRRDPVVDDAPVVPPASGATDARPA